MQYPLIMYLEFSGLIVRAIALDATLVSKLDIGLRSGPGCNNLVAALA